MCVLMQAPDILRLIRPVRPDFCFAMFLMSDARSRSPDIQATLDSLSRDLFLRIVLAPRRFFYPS